MDLVAGDDLNEGEEIVIRDGKVYPARQKCQYQYKDSPRCRRPAEWTLLDSGDETLHVCSEHKYDAMVSIGQRLVTMKEYAGD